MIISGAIIPLVFKQLFDKLHTFYTNSLRRRKTETCVTCFVLPLIGYVRELFAGRSSSNQVILVFPMIFRCFLGKAAIECAPHGDRSVAQPGSAPALGAGCRGFKSLHSDHSFSSPNVHRTLGS